MYLLDYFREEIKKGIDDFSKSLKRKLTQPIETTMGLYRALSQPLIWIKRQFDYCRRSPVRELARLHYCAKNRVSTCYLPPDLGDEHEDRADTFLPSKDQTTDSSKMRFDKVSESSVASKISKSRRKGA